MRNKSKPKKQENLDNQNTQNDHDDLTPEITCMFCKQPHTENVKMYEIKTKDINTDEYQTYHTCEYCIGHIQKFLSEVTNTPLKNPDHDDPKPEDAFIGMLLKDFLCTAMYINTTYNVIFYDYTGLEITEFSNYMQHPIHNIRKEDKIETIHVMLGKM